MPIRWPCIVVAMLCCLLAHVLAPSAGELQPFPPALLDPKFLASQTWDQTSAVENVVTDWSPYLEKQGFSDRTVLKGTKIEILGSAFEAEYRVFKNTPSLEIFFHSGAGDYKNDCSSFLGWSTRYLGTPDKAIDRSIPGKGDSFTDVEAEWLFGQTRVQAMCGGVKMGDSFIAALVAIVYGHHARLKTLQDLVYIQCSATKKYVGSFDKRATEQGAPLGLIIDPARERLLRGNKYPFTKTDRYSNDEIIASESNKDGSAVLNLNRVTGSYLMQVRIRMDANSGYDQWGKCEKVNPERKF
jgi:hypothetical protein